MPDQAEVSPEPQERVFFFTPWSEKRKELSKAPANELLKNSPYAPK